MRRFSTLVTALAVLSFAGGIQAQQKKKNPPPVSEKASASAKAAANASSATVDAIMETAVRNIGRRYNLNDAQLEETRALMKREVYKFLQEHEDAVWPLIRDLLKAQLGNRPPKDIEDVMRIGKGALPLAKKAEEAIIRANEEWRKYLSAEQRMTHDFDMKEMRKQFKSINENFERWAQGKPTGKSIFPEPQTASAGPPRPTKPRPGLPDPKVETIAEIPMFFTVYVNDFIAKYELDAGQANAAQSILNEFKEQVAKFRATNYKELAAVQQDLLAAQKDRDRKKVADVEGRRRALMKHVYELFSEMDGRLHGLLRTDQRERFAEVSQNASNTKSKTDSAPANEKQPSENKDQAGKSVKPDTPTSNDGGAKPNQAQNGGGI